MDEPHDKGPRQAAPTASGALVGHRGLSHYYPENTEASVDGAIAAGLYGVEVDLRASRDGVPFLVHDVRLQRAAGLKARVDELDAIALAQRTVTLTPPEPRSLAAPPRIVSFEAAYAPRADALRWYAEIKFDPRCVDEVARIWREHPPLPGSACMSFDRALCRRARAALPPEVLVARIHQESVEGGPLLDPIIEQTRADHLDAVALWHRHIDPPWVREAHEAGLQVFAWTVNDHESVDAALRANVDVLITDGPSPLLARFGKTPPPAP